MNKLHQISKEDAAKSVQVRKLIIPRDWWGDGVGILYLVAAWGINATIVYKENSNLSHSGIPLFLALTALLLYGIYCLSEERNLITVKTGLAPCKNQELVVEAFQLLGWVILQNKPQVIRASIRYKWYGPVSQTATALIDREDILVNVIHDSRGKGRIPFSFGYNARKSDALINLILKLAS